MREVGAGDVGRQRALKPLGGRDGRHLARIDDRRSPDACIGIATSCRSSKSAPRIEFRNLHRGYDGIRPSGAGRARLEAWCAGETGIAVRRRLHAVSLRATGWLNFGCARW
jgi:hypothetical protein